MALNDRETVRLPDIMPTTPIHAISKERWAREGDIPFGQDCVTAMCDTDESCLTAQSDVFVIRYRNDFAFRLSIGVNFNK